MTGSREPAVASRFASVADRFPPSGICVRKSDQGYYLQRVHNDLTARHPNFQAHMLIEEGHFATLAEAEARAEELSK